MQALKDRTAFITGGASGIGFGMAQAFAEVGMRLVLADLNREWLESACAQLQADVLPLHLDVTDRAAWREAALQVEKRFGALDVLCNNAGIGPSLDEVVDIPPAEWDRLTAIKLDGTYNGIATFGPAMRARRSGHIVNTASMAGIAAYPRLGAYTAAMFGVVGLSEVLRAELEPHGVGVSVLCPGLVRTRLGESTRRVLGKQDSAAATNSSAATGAGIDPLEVGRMVRTGIENNELYVITHPHRRAEIQARVGPLLAAFGASTPGAESGSPSNPKLR